MTQAYDIAGAVYLEIVYVRNPMLGESLPPISGFRIKLHKNDTFQDYDIFIPVAETRVEGGIYYYSVTQLASKFVWQVEDAGKVYSFVNDSPYVGTRITDSNQIIVTNFNGVTFTVEHTMGKIVDIGVTK